MSHFSWNVSSWILTKCYWWVISIILTTHYFVKVEGRKQVELSPTPAISLTTTLSSWKRRKRACGEGGHQPPTEERGRVALGLLRGNQAAVLPTSLYSFSCTMSHKWMSTLGSTNDPLPRSEVLSLVSALPVPHAGLVSQLLFLGLCFPTCRGGVCLIIWALRFLRLILFEVWSANWQQQPHLGNLSKCKSWSTRSTWALTLHC